jgi:hypothetical protein
MLQVQTNMALLLASYMLLCHGWQAEQAVKPFAMIGTLSSLRPHTLVA